TGGALRPTDDNKCRYSRDAQTHSPHVPLHWISAHAFGGSSCASSGQVACRRAATEADTARRRRLSSISRAALVLQHKRSDCGIASPVIAALRHVGGQNANR